MSEIDLLVGELISEVIDFVATSREFGFQLDGIPGSESQTKQITESTK